MQRGTSQEETPPPFLLTDLTQCLQIPHLANWRAPLHKQPLMQTPPGLHWRRPRLKRHGIARHGGEMLVVEPSHRGLVVLHTNRHTILLRAGLAVGGVGKVVPSHVARADHHDVARAGREALILHRLDEFGRRDLVAGHGGRWIAVFVLVPAEPVDEDAAADYASALAPVVRAVCD